MMSTKMATTVLLKGTVFWNRVYGVIIHVNDVIKIILWRHSNYTVDVFMWIKFGSSSISMRQVITTLVLYRFDQKNSFFEMWYLFSSIIRDWSAKPEILRQCGKRFKTKSQKVFGANSYICISYRGKTDRGNLFVRLPSWIGLIKLKLYFTTVNHLKWFQS